MIICSSPDVIIQGIASVTLRAVLFGFLILFTIPYFTSHLSCVILGALATLAMSEIVEDTDMLDAS